MKKTKISLLSVATFAVVLIVTLCVSCSKQDAEKLPAGSISLTGAGSSFDALLFKRWFTVYHESHPNVFIKYRFGGQRRRCSPLYRKAR